jgi:N-acetylglucosamine-6-phosphate deacetylase
VTRLGVGAAIIDGRLVPGDVDVTGAVVTAVGLPGRGGDLAVPGFVDLQVNGFDGVDFLAANVADYAVAGEALLATGVTAYQPTLITSPVEDIERALAVVGKAAAIDVGPRILGAHVEGPFLSPQRAGTHPIEHLREPDRHALRRLLDAGPVTQVTLAPELPGALELIDLLCARGIVVAVGHSAADAATAHAAFDRGATAVTHLFNAMRPLYPRDPGVAGVALVREDVAIGLIVDGIHLADETVLLAWRSAGGRLALVTDAVAAAGRGDGTYALGQVEVTVVGGEARRGDGTLAGSMLTMDAAVRNLVALGVPVVDAVGAATGVPARIVGRDDVGTLRVGGPADIVVLDDAMTVRRVVRAGREAR